jgi:hypothetical protein
MCRRNQLLGCCALSLGLGVLLGRGLESGLLCFCIGVGLVILGFGCVRQK